MKDKAIRKILPSFRGIKLVVNNIVLKNDDIPRYRIIKEENIIICNQYFYDNLDDILDQMNK